MRYSAQRILILGLMAALLLSTAVSWAVPLQLDLVKSGSGSGGVFSSPSGINCSGGCPSAFASYSSGTLVLLSARPASGSWFNGWSGGCSGSALDCRVSMDAAKSVTADFTVTPPVVPDWSKVLGSSAADVARAVRQTADGGSIVAGEMGGDAWVLKFSATGAIEWQKVYDGGAVEAASDISQTADGGYVVAGRNGGEAWVLRLAADGSILWQKNYGGSSTGQALSIRQTSDGGYVFAGLVTPLGAGGISDAWVVKLDANGAMLWEKSYGGAGYDAASAIQQTADGGYIVSGSYDTGGYALDAWLLKLSVLGDVEWQERFGISGSLAAVSQTADGGYVAAGQNGLDAWFVRLAANGAVTWQKAYNHFGNQSASAIVETGDGSFAASSMGALLRISADGATVIWESDYALINGDQLFSLHPASDGGFLAVGSSGPSWESELWLLKVNATGGVTGWTRPISSTFSATNAAAVATAVIPAGTGSTFAASAVTATTYFTLAVKRSGSGGGLVTSFEPSRPLIDCGKLCMAVYPANSTIDLNAAPLPSSTFDGWSGGGCSGTSLCTLTLNADTQVNAPFSNVNGTVVLNESFDSATLPAGWSIVTMPGDTPWASFASSNSPLALNSTRSGGGYMVADSLSTSELRTPLLNLAPYSAAVLTFRSEGGGGTAMVDVSGDGGATWKNVFVQNGSFSSGSTTSTINVSAAAGSGTAKLRLKFVGGDSNNWNVDDIQLIGYTDTAAPVDGTLSAAPGSGTVSLSWQPAIDSGSGVAAYLLAISGSSLPADCSSALDLGSDTTYLHTGLVNGSTYYYRVCARDMVGNVSSGATASATPLASIVSVSPLMATYPIQQVGSSSAPVSFTLTNTSSTNIVNITSLSLAGTAGGDYVLDTSGCGSVPPYFLYYLSSCTVTVSFAPQAGAAPTRTAILTAVTDEAGTPAVAVGLSGTAKVSISATAGSNGSISPAGTTFVATGSSQGYSFTPAAGYHVADVLVDGVSIGAPSGFTFASLSDNHTIDVTFALNQYSVTASVGANGSLSSSTPSPAVVGHGSPVTFVFDASSGYHVTSVSDSCGGTTYTNSSNAVASYSHTIAAITADCTVTASFAINSYTISATAGANGSISPSGTTTVSHGANLTYTITPQSGYRVASLLVDGSPVTPALSYSFSNVTAAHTIDVTFGIIQYTVTTAGSTGGSITPASTQVAINTSASFTVSIDTANGYRSVKVSGCGGILDNMVYTTAPVTADCTVTATFSLLPDGVIVPAPGKSAPDISDALRALKISLGMLPATAADLQNGDVGPLTGGVPQPDGVINLGDAVVLLRRSLNMASW